MAGSKTYGARRLLPIAVAFVAATLLLAGGTVFGVELLQRFFSQDYRALAALNGGAGWPPIPLFGREWAPLSPLTWLPPAVLVGAGALLARRASQRWQRLREDADTTDIAAGDAIEAGRNPA